jgi:hypothetical protein
MFHSDFDVNPWWQVALPVDAIVRTVLIVPSDHYIPETRSIFKLTIGNSASPTSNPVCVDFNLASGAYECPSAMTGLYLGIFRIITKEFLQINEIMAWSEYLISHTHFLSNLLYPQNVASTLGLKPRLYFNYGADSTNNAYANAHATAGWSNYTITLPGQIIIETVVVIPSYLATNNLEIVVTQSDSMVTYSKLLAEVPL